MKKIVGKIFVYLSVLLFLSCIYSKVIYGDFTIFGYKPFFIMSESMEPCISTYQIVIGKRINGKLEVGDIAAYELYSEVSPAFKETVIHRVYAINSDGSYVFKGDNNKDVDNRDISSSRVKYKIVLY